MISAFLERYLTCPLGVSVGATLGYAIALAGKKRVLACIGDGSFQLTAQVRPLDSLWLG